MEDVKPISIDGVKNEVLGLISDLLKIKKSIPADHQEPLCEMVTACGDISRAIKTAEDNRDSAAHPISSAQTLFELTELGTEGYTWEEARIFQDNKPGPTVVFWMQSSSSRLIRQVCRLPRPIEAVRIGTGFIPVAYAPPIETEAAYFTFRWNAEQNRTILQRVFSTEPVGPGEILLILPNHLVRDRLTKLEIVEGNSIFPPLREKKLMQYFHRHCQFQEYRPDIGDGEARYLIEPFAPEIKPELMHDISETAHSAREIWATICRRLPESWQKISDFISEKLERICHLVSKAVVAIQRTKLQLTVYWQLPAEGEGSRHKKVSCEPNMTIEDVFRLCLPVVDRDPGGVIFLVPEDDGRCIQTPPVDHCGYVMSGEVFAVNKVTVRQHDSFIGKIEDGNVVIARHKLIEVMSGNHQAIQLHHYIDSERREEQRDKQKAVRYHRQKVTTEGGQSLRLVAV